MQILLAVILSPNTMANCLCWVLQRAISQPKSTTSRNAQMPNQHLQQSSTEIFTKTRVANWKYENCLANPGTVFYVIVKFMKFVNGLYRRCHFSLIFFNHVSSQGKQPQVNWPVALECRYLSVGYTAISCFLWDFLDVSCLVTGSHD